MDEDLDYTFNPSAIIYPARAIALDTVNAGGCYLGTTGSLCVGITPQQSEFAPGMIGNSTYPYILAQPGDNSKVPVYGPMRRCLIDIDPAFGGTITPGTLIMSSVNGYGTAYVSASGVYYIIGIALSFATAGQSCNVKCMVFPINSLSGSGVSFSQANNNNTTVGAATLTAAQIVGGVITRSGPTAAYTDTTDTATNIIAALPAGVVAGQSWIMTIKNTVPYAETLSAGSGVTLSGDTVIPGNYAGVFLVNYVSAGTVTIRGLYVAPLTTSQGQGRSITNVTTVGNGTLLAAALITQIINRSGPTGAYTDTTDSATNIIAALPNAVIGQSFSVLIKNTTQYAETITGGSGVTVSGVTIIPPNSVGEYLFTYTAASTMTAVGLQATPYTATIPLAQTALATAGAGTITGVGIAGGLTLRTTVTSAATDTTDTGTNIAAAIPNIQVGDTFTYTYSNNSGVVMTLTGGSGVTFTPTSLTVGAGSWIQLLFTYTATNTFTSVPVAAGSNFGGLPAFQLTTGTTTTTFAAGQLTGAQFTVYTSTATTPGSIATRTATQMYGDVTGAFVGMSSLVRIVNNSGSANSLTLTAGAGVTLSGKTTYVITQFGFADFVLTFTSATAASLQFIGAGVGTSN